MGSLLDQAQLFAGSISRDVQLTSVAQSRIEQIGTKLDQLDQRTKALKTQQASFSKNLTAARKALADYRTAAAKPGAAGLAEARVALQAQAAALYADAQQLSKEAGQLEALQGQVPDLKQQLYWAKAQGNDALVDLKEAKAIISPLVAQMTKPAAKPAAGRPVAAPMADLSAPARALADRVTSDEARARATMTTALSREQKLRALIASGAASAAAASQRVKARQQLSKDAASAGDLLAQSNVIVKRAAERHRANAPNAKRVKCDIQKVDFGNFDYPNGAVSEIRKGKAAGDNPEAASLAKVDYSDLNGDGKKEAIVFLSMPNMGPHGDSYGELHFFEIDDACRIQEIGELSGGIEPGTVNDKDKTYTYTETVYEGVNGMGGNFPSGEQQVQLRYVNEMLVETKRKNPPSR